MQIGFSIFEDRALNVVRKAFAISRNCNYVSVDPSVMMVALIQEDKELFANVMQIMEVEQTGFCQELSYQIQRLPKSSIGDPQLNEASLRVLSEAMEIARMVGTQSVTIDFLLMALCYMPSCV